MNVMALIGDMQRDLSEAIFSMPPQDWAEFKSRQGRWLGLEDLRIAIQQAIDDERARDDDK